MRFETPRSQQQAAHHDFLPQRHPPQRHGDPEQQEIRCRVLLLTSGLGLGHVRAAQAIEAALESSAQVRVLDLWSLVNPNVVGAIHATYLTLVQNFPDLYERLYHLDEHTWRQILQSESGPPPAVLEVLELISAIARKAVTTAPRGGRHGSDRMLLSLLSASLPYDGDSLAGNGVRARLALIKWSWLRLIRRLEPAIEEFAPHVIISTQMIPSAMACWLKRRGRLNVPLIGVTTDFGIHDFWKQRGIDRYCVAHESIQSETDEPYGRVRQVVTGVPLMPDFARPLSQAEARRELRLPAEVPVVLVLGGGLGISVDTAAASLLGRKLDAHLIVMPGKNAAVRAALASVAARLTPRVRVCDWTDRMDVFLRAADIVVGKPGGITVAEALACGRPLLATRSLGGQEGFNISFLEHNSVGGLVPDGDLLERVQALLSDRATLHHMQRRAWLLGRREGAARIAELAHELATTSRLLALRVP
jgi:processive 1,2-diacylglycerol beta-glucosyltransferase